jgi:hypothetical protein
MFSFVQSVLPSQQPVDAGVVENIREGLLESVTQEADGSYSMKIRLPDISVIDAMAKAMAQFGATVRREES